MRTDLDWDALFRSELAPMVPYAPGLRVSEVRDRSGRETILKLSSNEHPCGPFPTALAAMEAVLPRLNRYPDGSARALRSRLAEKLSVPAENIVVSNGSNELLTLIGQACLDPADEIVFPWPSFVVYPMVAQLMGAKGVRVPLAAGQVHDLDAIAEAITERTKIVFLCNPNNPTGTFYDATAFSAFLKRVPDHVLVVVDEAYFEFVTDDSYARGLDHFEADGRIAVLRTFSKMFSLAGLRIGYGIVPTKLAEAIDKVREPFNVNTVAQVAAYYSLADDAEVARRRRENQEQKTYLYSVFDRLGIRYVRSQTNFIWIETDRPVEAFQALLEEGVIVRDFGNVPALRVGIGTPDDTRITEEAFSAVVKKLGAL